MKGEGKGGARGRFGRLPGWQGVWAVGYGPLQGGGMGDVWAREECRTRRLIAWLRFIY